MRPEIAGKAGTHVHGWIRLASFGVFAAALMTITPTALLAQSATVIEAPASVDLAVSTTKLLAIGSFTAKATQNVWKPFLPSEVRATARLYLAGKIDQWYVKSDQSGVVFVMNLTDPKEAQDLLSKLPMGQAGLMEFQFIPLGPLSPLRVLLTEPAK
jgi:hypothetical protein